MKLTVDASVFVARFIEEDAFHDVSSKFVRHLLATQTQVHVPSLLFAEVAGAVSRIKKDHVRGDLASLHLQHYDWLRIRSGDVQFGFSAAALASRHALRGADSHYLTVARETRTTLITLDDELLALDTKICRTMTPAAWLRKQTN
jgi:predicted nucleic acid-binding protein